MAKNKQLTVPMDEDFETILICAVRYSLGRMTYMPHVVMDYIRPLLPQLSTKALAVFQRDIKGAYSYGDANIDEPAWIKFLEEVRAELSRRESDCI